MFAITIELPLDPLGSTRNPSPIFAGKTRSLREWSPLSHINTGKICAKLVGFKKKNLFFKGAFTLARFRGPFRTKLARLVMKFFKQNVLA